MALLGLASCGVEAGAHDVSARRLPIVSGSASGSSDDAVVAIVFKSGTLRCTGTVIAPRVVLTAAHCGIGARNYWEYEVHFGSDLRAAGKRVPVVDALVHPEFVAATFANDLALLALRDESPVPPRPMRTTPIDAAEVGGDVRVVGFGQTAAAADDAGTRRQGITKLSAITPMEIELAGGASQPCSYDSGGPAFTTVAGIEVLTGVTSRGDSACMEYSKEIRVDAYAGFINDYLSKARPGARAIGERCLYDGHCASGSCLSAVDEPRIRYCSSACASDAECGGLKCVAGGSGKRCEKPRPTPGAPGADCRVDGDCLDAECRAGRDGAMFCARACSPLNTACTNGLVCTVVDEIRYICAPAPPPARESESGCSSAATTRGRGDRQLLPALLALTALLLRRRLANPRILRG